MQRYFTITQLTQEFDITTRTLRFYEAQGLVTPQRRGRQRLYTPGDRTRIKLILRGKRLGFSLAEVKELIGMYGSAPGEAGQLRLLMEKIAARREELLEKQRDIELTLLELEEVEAGALARMEELSPVTSEER
ncbi:MULTISPECIES: MerR family transcriptional regulator [Stappiaceae]|jgi:DNA-binding transcriptional MerR regulator|uniref:Putative transcriptional regulator n=1 Tax=Roseibium alexandrii (strain DSM 17067 / NCIMB 14079 / DFL-11) TaxID=244592 RepID=A0A5E8H2K6_ROSAD|nr:MULTISPECIES: MerR family DNA-binding transcriptional regulator [Stappiaceae]EEE46177.1 putative transcriptional regulator [Roseibium alexandrii DFL-11]MBO9419510.1 MerR family DNA-binding transcriptional regulator [Labrenzia sp. R4_2]MBO9426241.1 MerR family DNA-binding transcriptional regulator [Labrenzia sp. R4_1]OJJ11561.1 MerR family transcriptional regulator [Alphaproteobacteria bacterium AO1-B]